jgi:hypothetical protein
VEVSAKVYPKALRCESAIESAPPIQAVERDEFIPQEIDVQPFLSVDKSLGPHFLCIYSVIEPLVCS